MRACVRVCVCVCVFLFLAEQCHRRNIKVKLVEDSIGFNLAADTAKLAKCRVEEIEKIAGNVLCKVSCERKWGLPIIDDVTEKGFSHGTVD